MKYFVAFLLVLVIVEAWAIGLLVIRMRHLMEQIISYQNKPVPAADTISDAAPVSDELAVSAMAEPAQDAPAAESDAEFSPLWRAVLNAKKGVWLLKRGNPHVLLRVTPGQEVGRPVMIVERVLGRDRPDFKGGELAHVELIVVDGGRQGPDLVYMRMVDVHASSGSLPSAYRAWQEISEPSPQLPLEDAARYRLQHQLDRATPVETL